MIGHVKAPTIPNVVAVTESTAICTVLRFNSVRAKRTAVPETVATASDRRNQAIRKRTTCRSFAALLSVFHNDAQANEMYPSLKVAMIPRRGMDTVKGGPGRLRSHNAAGIEKAHHHKPTMNRTSRRGSVCDEGSGNVFLSAKRRRILRHWTKTAAIYPMPIPLEDILVESWSSTDPVLAIGLLAKESKTPGSSRSADPGVLCSEDKTSMGMFVGSRLWPPVKPLTTG